MEGLLTLDNLFTLLMLVFLQIVLGFDNLLYISIESKRVREDKQSHVRKWGWDWQFYSADPAVRHPGKAVDLFQEQAVWHPLDRPCRGLL